MSANFFHKNSLDRLAAKNALKIIELIGRIEQLEKRVMFSIKIFAL